MTGPRRACTVVARGSLHEARSMVTSFERYHPGTEIVTVIIDGTDLDRSALGLGVVLLPCDLLPGRGWADMAAIYDASGFAAALVPLVLTHLVADGGAAVYLAPDTVLYGSIDEMYEAALRSGVALTPQVLTPLPSDGRYPDDEMIRAHGTFNLGLLGVSSTGLPFLRWWADRARRDAVPDDHEVTSYQRWGDSVPALFGGEVVRDRGLNVGWWNLHERPLTRGWDAGLLAGGAPLRSLRFDGFDPETPWRLTLHDRGRPRTLLSDQPVLAELCAERALDAVASADDAYRFDTLPDTGVYTATVRRAFRTGLTTAENKGMPLPPNPFLETAEFREWLFGYGRGTPFSRFDMALRLSRPDLPMVFADPEGGHARSFAEWLRTDPYSIEQRVLAGADATHVPPSDSSKLLRPDGWSVLAYAHAEFGVGEAGRRMAAAVARVGCPSEVVGVVKTESRQQVAGRHVVSTVSFANTLTCVNADYMEGAWEYAGVAPWNGRRIGLWFWEVDVFPAKWAPIMSSLDEVWVTSEHTKAAIDAVGSRTPVRVVPLPVLPPAAPTSYTRNLLSMPEDRTVFLCSYDFFSVMRRKNPLDTIDAYCRAFGPDDGAVLLLKSINGHRRSAELEHVRHRAAGRPDILVQDGYVDAAEMQAMIELSDCVVSLHRAEGYGLNLIDAMAVATPVIATGYSGNLAFMDAENSFLVHYELVEVGSGSDPYEPHAQWAQPDLDHAALLMRAVHDDPAAAVERGRLGRASVLRRFDVRTVAAELRPLLLEGIVR